MEGGEWFISKNETLQMFKFDVDCMGSRFQCKYFLKDSLLTISVPIESQE